MEENQIITSSQPSQQDTEDINFIAPESISVPVTAPSQPPVQSNSLQSSDQSPHIKETATQSQQVSSSTDSSNKNSASSGNTGGTTSSSVDTVPAGTQEVTTSAVEEEEPDENYWGSFYPMNSSFYVLNMTDDEYLFGRVKTADYCFDLPNIKKNFKQLEKLSKKHFIVKRVEDASGSKKLVMLTDTSMNGVYINEALVGKNNTQQLVDKDEISLAFPKLKVLLFVDHTISDESLPDEFVKKYIMHKLIGSGAFGQVREVLSKYGTRRFAAKIINKQQIAMYLSQREESDMLQEARLMLRLRHPCVISVHDVINAENALYLILELAEGGELFNRLVSRGPMVNTTAKLLFFQMLSAVSYLHDNNVTHRDLKPENILLTSNDEECLLKITDFGMSRIIGEESLMQTQAGTRSYLAPEIIQHMDGRGQAGGYTRMVDSWSLGVILYMCISASPPFSSERKDTTDSLNQQILKADFSFSAKVWKNADERAKDLISKLLIVDAQDRLSPAQALMHDWLDDDEMKSKFYVLSSLDEAAKNRQSFFKDNTNELLLRLAKSESQESGSTGDVSVSQSGIKRELSNGTNSTKGSLSPQETKKMKTST